MDENFACRCRGCEGELIGGFEGELIRGFEEEEMR